MSNDTSMSNDNIAVFLEELTSLTKKHYVKIEGCGCCGSPFIEPLPSGQQESKYECTDDYFGGQQSRDLRWVEAK